MNTLAVIGAVIFPVCLVLVCILAGFASYQCLVGSLLCGKYVENKAYRKIFVVVMALLGVYCIQNLAMFLEKLLQLSAYLILML
jgi:hypothetical protein